MKKFELPCDFHCSDSLKTIFLIVILFFTLFFGFYCLVNNDFTRYRIIKNEFSRLSEKLREKEMQFSTEKLKQESIEKVQKSYNHWLKFLSQPVELPRVFEEISRAGLENRLKLHLFAPTTEINRDFYKEITVKIIVQGSYQQFALFLNSLRGIKPLVTFHDFSIEKTGSTRFKEEELLKITMLIKINPGNNHE